MEKRRIIYLMAAITLLMGCTSEQEEQPSGNVPISLGYQVVTVDDKTSTRSETSGLNDDNLKSGETVKVMISTDGGSTYSAYNYTTANDAGAMTPPNPAPVYPSDGSTVNILACYPSTAGTSFSVCNDQTDASGYKSSDLMWATPVLNQARTYRAVNLQLHHLMAKITVNATLGNGIASISSVTLKNVKRTVTFNQTTGLIGAASIDTSPNDGTDITLLNEGSALIPPQLIDGTFIEIVATSSLGDTETATYALNSKAFISGHEYTFNISVNSAALNTSNAITNWTSEGTVDVQTLGALPDMTPAGVVAVDLGLSVKWANMNVGATSATDYGTYFCWGETYGYTAGASNNRKNVSDYNWADYLWCDNETAVHSTDVTCLTKYNTMSQYGKDGFVDNKTKPELRDDAAYANWGGCWRFPTKAEFEELLSTSNCTWTWYANYNSSGVAGYLVTSKKSGYTNNSIFLPAAGVIIKDGFANVGIVGHYWTSTLDVTYPTRAYGAYLKSGEFSLFHNCDHRSAGRTVRAVQ
jgi:hypothetical protein